MIAFALEAPSCYFWYLLLQLYLLLQFHWGQIEFVRQVLPLLVDPFLFLFGFVLLRYGLSLGATDRHGGNHGTLIFLLVQR